MKTYRALLFVLFILVLTFGAVAPGHSQNRTDSYVVIIDPGHGGKDTGTPGTGRYKATEKDIALDVSLALGKMLESELEGIKVLYTRKRDVFPELWERPELANKKEADLFISIHCNAQPGRKGTAYGSETFVLGLHKEAMNLEVVKRENSVIYYEKDYKERYQGYDPNLPESQMAFSLMQEEFLDQSIELARNIEDEFISTAKRRSRGVKQAGFLVLAKTSMPSVLVELGFLTHKKEEDFLNSKKGKQLMAKSLFRAIKKFLDYHEVSSGQPELTINESSPVNIDKEEDSSIQYKVQIATGSSPLETKPYNFKGLNNVTRMKDGNLYKYFYGLSSDYNEISEFEKIAKQKGYKSSYIVAFKDGKKIPLSEALKSVAN